MNTWMNDERANEWMGGWMKRWMDGWMEKISSKMLPLQIWAKPSKRPFCGCSVSASIGWFQRKRCTTRQFFNVQRGEGEPVSTLLSRVAERMLPLQVCAPKEKSKLIRRKSIYLKRCCFNNVAIGGLEAENKTGSITSDEQIGEGRALIHDWNITRPVQESHPRLGIRSQVHRHPPRLLEGRRPPPRADIPHFNYGLSPEHDCLVCIGRLDGNRKVKRSWIHIKFLRWNRHYCVRGRRGKNGNVELHLQVRRDIVETDISELHATGRRDLQADSFAH